jgi:hypothetical protein
MAAAWTLDVDSENFRYWKQALIAIVISSIAEPEPQGAALRYGYDGSGPTNVIKNGWNWKITQNDTVYNPFRSYFQQYKSYWIKWKK